MRDDCVVVVVHKILMDRTPSQNSLSLFGYYSEFYKCNSKSSLLSLKLPLKGVISSLGSM